MLRSFVVKRATKHLSVDLTERFFGRIPTMARPQNDATEGFFGRISTLTRPRDDARWNGEDSEPAVPAAGSE